MRVGPKILSDNRLILNQGSQSSNNIPFPEGPLGTC